MVKEILSDAKRGMQKAVEAFQHEMMTIRTGRATTSLLDTIRVDYYGSKAPIQQMASIGVPEPRLITIQPWDKSTISAIEKSILASNLGLVPSNDGSIIRLPIPQLTEERRKELVRMVRQLGEEGRVAVRNTRREANELLKEAQKSGEVAEDESKRGQHQIQELTDEYVEKVDDLLKEKEEEIMEI